MYEVHTRIFSEATIRQSASWVSEVTVLPFLREEATDTRIARFMKALRNAFVASRFAKTNDIIIFGDSAPLSISLAIMLASLKRHRPTILRLDPLLKHPKVVWKRWYSHAWMRATDKLIVYAPSVLERYHQVYGFAKYKMQVVYFHHTLAGYDNLKVEEGDYVFAGGDSLRDYPTLLRAVENTDIPVVIATRLQIRGDIPQNVRVTCCTPSEFRQLMAGAKFVVLPLDMKQLSTTGQQSYLNAMALGKLVVVTDTVDASYYIEDGVTGLLTPCGDVAALRRAILWAWQHNEERRLIGQRAKNFAFPKDTEWWCRQVLEIARRVHAERADA